MKYLLTTLLLVCALFSCSKDRDNEVLPEVEKEALIFSKTAGFRHESINAGVTMFRQQAEGWNIHVTHTEDADLFTADQLKKFDVVVLLNSTGDVFSEEQQQALESYIRSGGALLGIHGAIDAEYNWPWYSQMMGGWFESHPQIQKATCIVTSPQHVSATSLPEKWMRTDEWYNFKNLQPDNQVVISIDETTYEGGKNGKDHPISWYRNFQNGKIYYTAMGHTTETYSEPLFIQHIGGALKWLAEGD